MVRRTLLLAILILSLAACKHYPGPVPTPEVPNAAETVSQVVSMPFNLTCEELEEAFLSDDTIETVPCITKQDGIWVLITDWDREEPIRLNTCNNEDGSPMEALPCIYTAKNPKKALWLYIVYLKVSR